MKKKLLIFVAALTLLATIGLNCLYTSVAALVAIILAVLFISWATAIPTMPDEGNPWWQTKSLPTLVWILVFSGITAAILMVLSGNTAAQVFVIKEAKGLFAITLSVLGILGAMSIGFGFKVRNREWLMRIAGGIAAILGATLGFDLMLDCLSKQVNSTCTHAFFWSIILALLGFAISGKKGKEQIQVQEEEQE